MKTSKYFLTGAGFFAGILIGLSMVALVSFKSAPVPGNPGGDLIPVTASQAGTYLAGYIAGAAPVNQVVKGFMVDRSQLDAMNALSSENPGLAGFRVYFGRDNNGRKLGIVVGVDAAGNDAVGNTIYSTDAPGASPCPPSCDVNSPISGGR